EGPKPPPVAEIAKLLNIAESDILHDGDFPQFYGCPMQFLFVPLRDRKVLAKVDVDPVLSRKWQPTWGTTKIYAFSYDPERETSNIRARMFAHEFGINEDPATGSAAAAFAGYLARRSWHKEGTLRWLIEQGFEMGRPSLLHLEADLAHGALAAVRVGG